MCVHVTKIDVQFLAMCLLPIISHDYLFCLFFSHMCCLCTYACVRICVHSRVCVRLCVRVSGCLCARVRVSPLLSSFTCLLSLLLELGIALQKGYHLMSADLLRLVRLEKLLLQSCILLLGFQELSNT